MNMDLNKVMLIGRATNKPTEHIIEGSNQVVSNLNLATNRYFTDKEGTKHEEVEFHQVTAFGNLAALLNKYVYKGKKMYVEGRLKIKVYTDKNGIERKQTQIIADSVIFLDNKNPDTTTPSDDDDAPY